MSGGGGPTSSTVTQTNIPDWLRPQVEGLLGGAVQELFDVEKTEEGYYQPTGVRPFVPYKQNKEEYVAGFTPLQRESFANALNMQVPGQFSEASRMSQAAGLGGTAAAQQAANYGAQAAGLSPYAQQYGGMGSMYGSQAAGLAPQAQMYGGLGSTYGAQAAGLAPAAQQYGQTAANIGSMGLRAQGMGEDIAAQSRDYAARQAAMGDVFAGEMLSPSITQAYMAPYLQNVVTSQQNAAQREADIAAQANKAQFAKAGAFGGARQGIAESQAAANLARQKQDIQARGLQDAFSQARNAQQQAAQLRTQGLAGAQAGLGTALQGGQLGLTGVGQAMAGQQAGMQGLGQAAQLYSAGMQGAGMGLQGLGQASQLYGAGMQGAGLGLQGIGQANQLYGTGLQGVNAALGGYGLLGQQAGVMGGLGAQQLGAQTGITELQSRLGATERQREQDIINQSIQDFATAQQYPLQQYNAYNALLRGYAVPGQTATTYQAPPNAASQIAGLGIGAAGLSKMFAKGGAVKETKRMATGGIPEVNRKVLFDPDSVSLDQIKKGVQNETLSDMIGIPAALHKQKMQQKAMAMQPPADQPSIAEQALGLDRLKSNLPMAMAKGGIIAFNGEEESLVPDTAPATSKSLVPGTVPATPKSPRKNLSDILAEVRTAYGDTERPTPERRAYMEAIKSGQYKPEDIEQQKGLRLLQAGLGVMGGRSPNAFANIAEGISPAVEGYSKDLEKYKTAKIGELKSLADLAEAQRLEKRGDVKTAADLYSKQLDREQRVETASKKDLMLYAEQYTQMKRAAGDTRPDSVLMNEGMKEYMRESGQAAYKVAAMLSGQGVQQGIAAGSQDLTRAGQEQSGEAKAIENWNNLKISSPDAMKYRRLMKTDPEAAEKFKQDWIKSNTPKPTVAPSPVPSPARTSTAKPAPAAPAEKPAKKPDISGITGAPAGSSIGGFIQGKGWEVKDKSGKLLGYAQ